MKILFVTCLVLGGSISLLFAQQKVDFFKVSESTEATEAKPIQSERLKQLRAQRDAALSRAMAPIIAPYREELKKLKVSYTQAGNLDAALHAKSFEDVASGKPAMKDLDGQVPERLAAVVANKESAEQRVSSPIHETYASEVSKLIKQATQEGKLDEAIECKNELAAINGKGPVGESAGNLPEFSEQFLIGTNWELPQGKEIVLLNFESPELFRVHKKDAAGKWQPGGTRKWAMEDVSRRQIRIFWHIGARVATLNPKLTEMSDGKNDMTRVELSE